MLAHGLIDAGNSISVIDLAESDEVIVKDDRGAEVHRMRGGNLHWFAGKLPLAGKVLALPIREIEYSIAVWRGVRRANKLRKLDLIEGTETGMLLVAMLSRRTPVIIRLHGEQYTFHKYTPGMRLTLGVRLSRVLQRIALRRAKLLISPSFAHAREIQQELGSHPPIVVVPNGHSVRNMERDLAIQRSPQTVLYVGRIERLKGISTLLQAASQTSKALPQSHFVFAGDFQSSLSESEFRSLVRQNGLDSHVELLGAVGWKVLSDWYQRSTVSVLPSHYETFGVAALEPMAFGTPVIATSGGAMSEVVESEVSGKLVAPGDAGALAGAMTELLSNANSREQMSQAAFKRAAIFDIRRVLPLNSRPYEWCRDEDWSAGSSHLFFSPHLDDAVLSCGGMIHSLVSKNKSVRVITVFAGNSDEAQRSAFARHLHAKAGSTADLCEQRRQEDSHALGELGVRNVERWNFTEAPYRRATNGRYLYGSYAELRGQPAIEDRSLKETITEKVLKLLQEAPESAVVYFPLSLGRHVDHQLLFAIGLQLSSGGKRVRFYEDYPYAEAYDPDHRELNWLPRTMSIDLESKLKAAAAYVTQIRGLGGSVQNLEKRLRAFGVAVGGQSISERYWEVITPVSGDLNGNQTRYSCPLVRKGALPRLRDFKNFLRTFRWHDLEEVLPVGDGRCLDLGCGEGRHRPLIESNGYEWLGMDRAESGSSSLQSEASSLPFQSDSMAALVAWQVFEYLDRPEAVMAEAARVLEVGGVFCGSVSFLEPVHGRTYFNMSPLILKELLARHGFADIEIKAGLNGFALMLWTWLRRSRLPLADHVAIPAAFALFAPLSAVMFFVSWLAQRCGWGSGHTMRWISQVSPLEFAGHVMFTARKKARADSCTSVS
jgi:glycosyltransferase involved in cell wall biosynthesis/LmbE family N-acetylglucosaminyl deacetylase/SAM-dependent methyltransferase